MASEQQVKKLAEEKLSSPHITEAAKEVIRCDKCMTIDTFRPWAAVLTGGSGGCDLMSSWGLYSIARPHITTIIMQHFCPAASLSCFLGF